MLYSLRRAVHLYLLKDSLKTHRVTRKTTGLEKATEIGILFDASDTDETAIINNFADTLRKQKKKSV